MIEPGRNTWRLLRSLVFVGLVMSVSLSSSGDPTRVDVQADKRIATVPDGLYGVGYDGWGDITNPQAVAHLSAVRVKYCRIEVNLRELCGDRFGDFRWEYTTPRDLGVGFISRVRKILSHGWTPILALTTSHALPAWFYGEATDANGKPWTRFNLDGTEAAEGRSNQYVELFQVTRGIAAGLSERGLRGLSWETIYEIGHTMPMADIHYTAARGIRQADPKAKVMGPATWPGWTVEERFVKPFLSKYGPELLDSVTMHWYADNEHGLWAAPGWKERKGPTTMADGLFLTYLMETTPKYAEWCRSLKKLLNDPKLNPQGKPIGIVFTEFDALAESAYGRDPENVDWPNYREDADCYLNTNHFGGVWCASVLCHLAASGCLDIACKFNTRQFYGLIDNTSKGGFYRQPVWFAWKLMQDEAGMRPGARMLATSVVGPKDKSEEHVGGKDTSWVEAFGVQAREGLRLVLINRSLAAQPVSVVVSGLPKGKGAREVRRFVFDRDRVAQFIGRKPGTNAEGAFAGTPGDVPSTRCLQAVETLAGSRRGHLLLLPKLLCPPISMTVLVLGPPQ